MNPKYYYDPYAAPWGMENQTFGIVLMVGLAVLFVAAVAWAFYGNAIIDWWQDRPNRKRIKSIVIKIKGTEMSKKKFQLTTDDINKIFAGEKLFGTLKARGKKRLQSRNIISITSIPGEDCRYFVVWYKEGV